MNYVHARYTGNTKLMRETGDSLCQLKTLMPYRKYMGEGGVCVCLPVYVHVWIAEARACDDSRGIVYVVAG